MRLITESSIVDAITASGIRAILVDPHDPDRAPKPVVEKDQLKQGKELLQRTQRAMGGAEKLAAVKDATHKMEIA